MAIYTSRIHNNMNVNKTLSNRYDNNTSRYFVTVLVTHRHY